MQPAGPEGVVHSRKKNGLMLMPSGNRRGGKDLAYGVVIPAYNAARTFRAAIDYILLQTVPPDAVVVVDDGSTDDTANIAAAFGPPVRLLSQENQGPGHATDRGWAVLDNTFLAGLDADDLWHAEKAERQIEELLNFPEVDAVFCRSNAPASAIRAYARPPGKIKNSATGPDSLRLNRIYYGC